MPKWVLASVSRISCLASQLGRSGDWTTLMVKREKGTWPHLNFGPTILRGVSTAQAINSDHDSYPSSTYYVIIVLHITLASISLDEIEAKGSWPGLIACTDETLLKSVVPEFKHTCSSSFSCHHSFQDNADWQLSLSYWCEHESTLFSSMPTVSIYNYEPYLSPSIWLPIDHKQTWNLLQKASNAKLMERYEDNIPTSPPPPVAILPNWPHASTPVVVPMITLVILSASIVPPRLCSDCVEGEEINLLEGDMHCVKSDDRKEKLEWQQQSMEFDDTDSNYSSLEEWLIILIWLCGLHYAMTTNQVYISHGIQVCKWYLRKTNMTS